MRTFIYITPLLIGLTAGLSAAPAAAQQKGLAAKASLSAALKKVQAGGILNDLAGLLGSMNQVTTQVDTVSTKVDQDLPNEYAGYNDVVTQLNNFIAQDCSQGNLACDTSKPGVNGYIATLKNTAIPNYQAAVNGLPKQADVKSAVDTVENAVNKIDAGDKTQLQAFEQTINTAQTNVNSSINAIDGLLADIENASEPTAASSPRSLRR